MKALVLSSLLFITIFIGCLQLFGITLEEMVLYSNQPYPLLLQKKLHSDSDTASRIKLSINETSFIDLNQDYFIKSENTSSIILNEEKQDDLMINPEWTRILLISNLEWFEE